MSNERQQSECRDAAIVITCMICNVPHEICTTRIGMMRWNLGEHIQTAMPFLSADEREIMVSKICGSCFDALHGGDDDEME